MLLSLLFPPSVSSEMGNREQSTLKSDSGYGDDASETAHGPHPDGHPLSRFSLSSPVILPATDEECSAAKGYDIGSASKLQVGDVFEFLWADAPEFEWEWKCLGYTRFIVLRHSETFPHHCACIPISNGASTKHEFAKPGIDSFQQGYVFANGDPNPGHEQPTGGPRLPYSPVGIELRPGRLRVKEDSRANYADIIDIDHDAQVMVVGDVVRYFDRVRRNVNKAFMRQILRKALEEYRAGRAGGDGTQREGSLRAAESVDGDAGGADCKSSDTEADTHAEVEPEVGPPPEPQHEPPARPQSRPKADSVPPQARPKADPVPQPEPALPPQWTPSRSSTSLVEERKDEMRPAQTKREERKQERRPSKLEGERRPSRLEERPAKPSGDGKQPEKRSRALSLKKPQRDADYDLMSLHNVAMAGLK
ncbi:Uu.00g142190.m01.CDS01 [Anthostomella pinea]|uniref:Uu.00g142190.m01.CDS01 n=1 Tax=Anthostomella pinea TaxID=933095 RepID=A0AAI8VRC2_9PEZI|nr:Uu.00g142190.m01.CDS01 [Anthostomella pinea]